MNIAIVSLFFILIILSCKDHNRTQHDKFSNPNKYEVISEKTISFGNHNRIGDIKKTLDGNYLMFINVKPDSGTRPEVTYGINYFLKISPSGDTLGKTRISFNHFLTDYIELHDCYYVVTTDWRTMGGPTTDHLSKYDKNWKLLWTKRIGKPKSPDGNAVLRLTKNNELLLISDEYQSPDELISHHVICIRRYNLNGKIISEKHYQNNKYNNPVSLIATQTDNFLLTAVTHDGKNSTLWLLKINLYGDTLWTKTHSEFYPIKALQLKDSNFLFYGVNHDTANNSMTIFLKVLKLDKVGNLLWEKSVKGNYNALPGNVVETDDGFLFSATIEPVKNEISLPYLFALNNDGKQVFTMKYDYHIGIGSVPLLIQANKSITMIFQKWIGQFGEPFRDVIQIVRLTK